MSYVSLSEDIVDRTSQELDAIRLQIVVIPSHATDAARRVEGLIARCDKILAKLTDALTDPELKSSRASVDERGRYDALAKRHRRIVGANRNCREQLLKKSERIATQSGKLKQQQEEIRSLKSESRKFMKQLSDTESTIQKQAHKIDHLTSEVAWQKSEIEKLQDEINTAAWKNEINNLSAPSGDRSGMAIKIPSKRR